MRGTHTVTGLTLKSLELSRSGLITLDALGATYTTGFWDMPSMAAMRCMTDSLMVGKISDAYWVGTMAATPLVFVHLKQSMSTWVIDL